MKCSIQERPACPVTFPHLAPINKAGPRAPDLVEFAQLQARFESFQLVLTEKDKSIERLDNDLKKAGQREEDLKQMHNNYMLQVQPLINARALTPLGSTKREAKTRK